MTVTEESNWVEPADIIEARQRLDELTEEVVNIQDQLGASKLFDKNEFDTEEEWRDWRKRAAVALRYRVTEQRRYKNWVHDHNRTDGSSYADLLVQVVERLDTIIMLLSED